MRIEYKGYFLTTAAPTGGKAGKGYNKQTSFAVTAPNVYTLRRLYRWNVAEAGSLAAAIQRAKKWIDAHPLKVCPVCKRTLVSEAGKLPHHKTDFGGSTPCPYTMVPQDY